jgi:hypothetical protein
MAVSKDKQKRLEKLKIWCNEFVDYLIKRESSASFFEKMKIPINKSFDRGDLKSLEMIRGELSSFLYDFPQDERESLERALYEKSGIAAVDINAKVERLLLKGRISRDDEFRMLGDYINELIAVGGENSAVTINTINTMMRNYEMEKAGVK